MIADLLHFKIAAVAGVSTRVSPDLRRGTGDALPCVVYEIEADDRLDLLNPAYTFGRSACTVHCLALTLNAAIAIAEDITAGMHGATWTVGAAEAIKCRVLSMQTGTLDDSESGATDLTRTATLRLDILHKF